MVCACVRVCVCAVCGVRCAVCKSEVCVCSDIFAHGSDRADRTWGAFMSIKRNTHDT